MVPRRHDPHRGRLHRLRRGRDPGGSRDRLLGGSAVHFAIASSYFAETRVVGPVGDDFGEAEYEVLRRRGVVTDDIEHVAGGKTFFWHGRYHRDINLRDTLTRTSTCSRTSSPSCPRRRATPTSCSWPTSSPTCSGRCASSARAPASWPWTR